MFMNIEVEEKQNSLFPERPVISVLFFLRTQIYGKYNTTNKYLSDHIMISERT